MLVNITILILNIRYFIYYTLIGSCNAIKANNVIMEINFALKFNLDHHKKFKLETFYIIMTEVYINEIL